MAKYKATMYSAPHDALASRILPSHRPVAYQWALHLIDGIGFAHAHDVILVSLRRLSALHPSTYAEAISVEFSPPDLFALIDYLRLALARTGWFARHDDDIGVSPTLIDGDETDRPAPEPGAPHPALASTIPRDSVHDPLARSAQLAVALLNVALDALGLESHGPSQGRR